MSREPIVHAVAGMAFGFGLGYLVASARAPEVPPPVTPSATSASPLAAPKAPIDANEARALESVAARDKANVSVRAKLGHLYTEAGQWDKAARWYREAVALRREPEVIVDLGTALLRGGRPTEGLAEFERALTLAPGHKRASFNKGLALMELGRQESAADLWEDLLGRFPDDPELQAVKPRIEAVRARARARTLP
ncbi:MAG TPA: tetratricopeptide repeat protein [Vicinamibacteria bacterium]